MAEGRRGQTALMVGGGIWQVPLIERAASFGLRVIVTDVSGNAPGRRVADRFVQIDTNNVPEMIELARAERAVVVLGDQSDRLVPIVAQINAALDLPGIRPEIARRFTDKKCMRDQMLQSDVAMPRYAEVATANAAAKFAVDWGYPVVLKPKTCWASVGVQKVDDADQLSTAFPETAKHSADGNVLVEEFISGTEVTVEGICLAGKFTPLAVSEKAHYPHNPCVAFRLAYPPRFPSEVVDRIKSRCHTAVTRLGLIDGLVHAEFRLRDGEPHLMEIAARGGGHGIASQIVPHVSGVDTYELLLNRLLTGETSEVQSAWKSAILEFFQFSPGSVRAIKGVDVVERERLAATLEVPLEAGTQIRLADDDRTRPGHFVVLADSRDQADAKAGRIRELVQVDYESMTDAA